MKVYIILKVINESQPDCASIYGVYEHKEKAETVLKDLVNDEYNYYDIWEEIIQ